MTHVKKLHHKHIFYFKHSHFQKPEQKTCRKKVELARFGIIYVFYSGFRKREHFIEKDMYV